MENEGGKGHVVFVDHSVIEPWKSKHPREASAEVFSGEVFDEAEERLLKEQSTKSLAPTHKKYDFKLLKFIQAHQWHGEVLPDRESRGAFVFYTA